MDPLSQIVSTLKPKHLRAVGLEAGGAWSLAFGPYEGIKFNAVMRGDCWLSMDGLAAPLRISAGDCFLLTQGTPFRLATHLEAPSTDAASILGPLRGGATARLNEGNDFLLFGSRFILDGEHARFLLNSLPPLVHIRASDHDETLAWALQRLQRELGEERAGGTLAVEHLAHLMLIEVLRRYVANGAPDTMGWLRALSDGRISRALSLMHEQPARRWTLTDLAGKIGMSRTSFAVRFKACVGLPPLEYLTRWRMVLASDHLVSSGTSVATVASALGYESESAFGAAFKRVMGCSPRKYARSRAVNAQG